MFAPSGLTPPLLPLEPQRTPLRSGQAPLATLPTLSLHSSPPFTHYRPLHYSLSFFSGIRVALRRVRCLTLRPHSGVLRDLAPPSRPTAGCSGHPLRSQLSIRMLGTLVCIRLPPRHLRPHPNSLTSLEVFIPHRPPIPPYLTSHLQHPRSIMVSFHSISTPSHPVTSSPHRHNAAQCIVRSPRVKSCQPHRLGIPAQLHSRASVTTFKKILTPSAQRRLRMGIGTRQSLILQKKSRSFENKMYTQP